MCRLSPLDKPNPDNDAVRQHVRRLATLVRLVLRLADEFGFDGLRAVDLCHVGAIGWNVG